MDGEDIRELVLRERYERVGPEGESKGKLALTLSNGMWYGGRGDVVMWYGGRGDSLPLPLPSGVAGIANPGVLRAGEVALPPHWLLALGKVALHLTPDREGNQVSQSDGSRVGELAQPLSRL